MRIHPPSKDASYRFQEMVRHASEKALVEKRLEELTKSAEIASAFADEREGDLVAQLQRAQEDSEAAIAAALAEKNKESNKGLDFLASLSRQTQKKAPKRISQDEYKAWLLEKKREETFKRLTMAKMDGHASKLRKCIQAADDDTVPTAFVILPAPLEPSA